MECIVEYILVLLFPTILSSQKPALAVGAERLKER